MSRESIHKKFVKEVERLGLDVSQKAFAKKMAVKEPIISMYLTGKRNVSLDFLKRFCELYELDYHEMIRGEEEAPQKLGDKELVAMFLTISKTQTIILENIEKNMARASAQTILEGKIDDVLSSLVDSKKVDLLAAKHLDSQFQKISNLLLQAESHKKGASEDADNKLDGNGEGAQIPRRRGKGGK